MKRLLLAVVLLLLPAPALAANDTISITLTTVAAGCSAGCTKTMNGPASVNLLPLITAAYQSACNASINGTCTTAQVINYWALQVGARLAADLYAAQVNSATATAAAGVSQTPIQ